MLGLVPLLFCRGMRVGVLLVLLVVIPRWRSLCGRSLVDSCNPSIWRQGRRAVAWTSKHILVFAYGSFSLNLSLFNCIIFYCSYVYMLNIVYVFTLVFNQESYWSTSTLNLEESWGEIQSSSWEIQTYSWLHFVC